MFTNKELVANELKISVKTITGQKEIPPTEKVDGMEKNPMQNWIYPLRL